MAARLQRAAVPALPPVALHNTHHNARRPPPRIAILALAQLCGDLRAGVDLLLVRCRLFGWQPFGVRLPLRLGQQLNRHDVALHRSVHVHPAAYQNVLPHRLAGNPPLVRVEAARPQCALVEPPRLDPGRDLRQGAVFLKHTFPFAVLFPRRVQLRLCRLTECDQVKQLRCIDAPFGVLLHAARFDAQFGGFPPAVHVIAQQQDGGRALGKMCPVPGGHHSDGAVVAVIGTLARLSRHIRLPMVFIGKHVKAASFVLAQAAQAVVNRQPTVLDLLQYHR
mmetsp:Transcript_17038/g.30448  ORF Transcript_17038/g.30448 Transcript_17038/m.30448 type:complete len:279 (-) Transcript_17038:240-1076(-)